MKRIIIAGSRRTQKRDYILRAFGPLIEPGNENIRYCHGACPTGADAIVHEHLLSLGLEKYIEAYPADWKAYGRWAGPKRNKEMIELGPDLIIAFPDTDPAFKGTRGLIALAIEAEIPILVYPV